MMTKKDFIALADSIQLALGMSDINTRAVWLSALQNFCRKQNPRFNLTRWLAYIRGECGPSGGAIRKPKEDKP